MSAQVVHQEVHTYHLLASNATTSPVSQQRAGGDGGGSATGSSGVGTSGCNFTTILPGQISPSHTQSGIPATCTEYAKAQSESFSSLFYIRLQTLVTWNPVFGPNGAYCQTDFWAGNYYCVGVSSASSSSTTTSLNLVITTTTTTTTAPPSTPSPVQASINPQCTTYTQAPPGTSCTAFATIKNITPSQLHAWNPILGADGADCSTEMLVGSYYCVGAPSSSSSFFFFSSSCRVFSTYEHDDDNDNSSGSSCASSTGT